MNITKRKTGYRIRIYGGKDSNGKQKVYSKTVSFKDPLLSDLTEKQREKAIYAMALAFENECLGLSLAPNVKFSELADRWFEEYAKIQQRPTTFERSLQLKHRTYAALGHLRMDKITTGTIQMFINSLTKSGVNQNKKDSGLSSKTIKHYLSFISLVFDFAIRLGMLNKNPCCNVILPPDTQKEKNIYTIAEATEFLNLVFSNAPLKYQCFAALAIYGGFRCSEILALKYSDIDGNIVHIRRTANQTKERGMYIGETKTRTSYRSVMLPDIAIEKINLLKAEQAKQKEFMEIVPSDDDFIFCSMDFSQIMYSSEPYNYLKKFCKRYNMPFYGLHSFRHFTASVMLAQGTDIKTVSSVLGHSTPSTTLGIYAHVIAEQQAKATQAVADVLNIN